MRWVDLALFAAPFVLFAAWRIAAARAQPALLWGAVAAVAALAAGTVWFGLSRRLDRGQTYVPAHIEDGRIVPGHGVPAGGQ
jgi:type II secretory pathway component PulM